MVDKADLMLKQGYCFSFTFAILDGRSNMTVYSHDYSEIVLFINQHGFPFDSCKDYIEQLYIDEELYDKLYDNNNILSLNVFRSNHTNEKFSIITTPSIIDKCLTNTGDRLKRSSWFGEIVTISEIPIIDIINTLLDNLKYSIILDYQMITDDSISDTPQDIYVDPIYDKLFQDYFKVADTDNPLPMTIEGYVEGFNSLM